MNMIQWNPLREMTVLRNEFDRLFDEVLNTSDVQSNRRGSLWSLPLDVSENGDSFTITASLPGFSPDDVDITLADNVLTIKASYQQEQEQQGDDVRFHLRERRQGSYQRSLTLPTAVDADNIDASFAHGVLTLTVPKAEEVKPRRIPIRAGANGSNGNKMIEGSYSN